MHQCCTSRLLASALDPSDNAADLRLLCPMLMATQAMPGLPFYLAGCMCNARSACAAAPNGHCAKQCSCCFECHDAIPTKATVCVEQCTQAGQA